MERYIATGFSAMPPLQTHHPRPRRTFEIEVSQNPVFEEHPWRFPSEQDCDPVFVR
jgi:hypothetical protein